MVEKVLAKSVDEILGGVDDELVVKVVYGMLDESVDEIVNEIADELADEVYVVVDESVDEVVDKVVDVVLNVVVAKELVVKPVIGI